MGIFLAQFLLIWGQDLGLQMQLYALDSKLVSKPHPCVGSRSKITASGTSLAAEHGWDLAACAQAHSPTPQGQRRALGLTMDSLMRSSRRASSMLSFGQ